MSAAPSMSLFGCRAGPRVAGCLLVGTSADGLANTLRKYSLSIREASSTGVKQPPSHSMTLKGLGKVPGPRGLPLIGTTLTYALERDGYSFGKMFEAYARRADEYGPIYKEKIGPLTGVVVSDYSEYRKVIQKEGKTPARFPMEPLKCYRLYRGLGEGLASSNGCEWLRQRTAVNKRLLRPHDVVQYAPEMNEVAEDFLSYLSRDLNQRGEYTHLLENAFSNWALESAGTALLGSRIGALDDDSAAGQAFVKHMRGAFDGMHKLIYGLPLYKLVSTATWREFVRDCDAVYGLGASILSERLKARGCARGDASFTSASAASDTATPSQKRGADSLLAHLLENDELSRTDVEALLLELMLGAMQTVTSTILWCLYELSRSPHGVQEKLHAEVSRSLRPGEVVSLDTVARLPYLKACVRECLRLRSPAFTLTRFLPEDVELCGHVLPSGTIVYANIYYMNRCPKTFDRPLHFDPDRWMSAAGGGGEGGSGGGCLSSDASAVVQLVWGHGARMCVGRRIAEQQLYTLLAKLIQRFRIEFHGSNHPQPILKLAVQPDREINLRFIARC